MIQDKIKTREELQALSKKLKSQGNKVGFTSGAFDLFHAGHADYLEKAKALCDVLIVGVNTDASVKKYKGPDRPINSEKHRIQVVAALESVDYVFLFSERRNKKNIEMLQSDLYVKAGDYSEASLTSKEIVEAYGGSVQLVPIAQDISTSNILSKASLSHNPISQFIEKEGAVHQDLKPPKQVPAVFFDRDGTINEDVSYLHDPEKFQLIPNAAKGIKKIQDMGYRIAIITNQPGIGIGYFTEADFYKVNRAMLSAFSKYGILVDKIYFCPHSKAAGCNCRKPGLALVQRAVEELNLDLSRCIFIGDKTSDMETGRRAGMQTILVKTGFKGEDGEFPGEPDCWADDLFDAAGKILESERK